ncbi:hypothetical protein [Pseudomonas sp. NY15354]|uniref:hypothetical protein n=1 Tax=Pseudomonas sp. NY15354 TaxID=3400351 RepID=UPI003A887595
MSKVIVTFEKNWRGYAAGETAGFEASVAQGLIEGGYAIEAGKQGSKKSAKSGAGSTSGAAKKDESGSAAGNEGGTAASADDEGKP